MARMKATPVNDAYTSNGSIRADQRMTHDLYVVKVRAPGELPEPHAWYEVLATIPATTAFAVGTECKMTQ